RSLLHRAESGFRDVVQHDAGCGRDGQKTPVIERSKVEAETIEIVGEKDGAADFGVDGIAVGIGKSEPERQRRKLIDVGNKAPMMREQRLHCELLLVASLWMANAHIVLKAAVDDAEIGVFDGGIFKWPGAKFAPFFGTAPAEV